MDQIENLFNHLKYYIEKSSTYNVLHYYQEKYLVRLLSKSEFTAHLVHYTPSKIITLGLLYLAFILGVYEAILNIGVYFKLWPHPADEVFEEIPVHCAHVYVSVNIMLDSTKKEEDSDESNNKKLLLKYPIVYHFEFSPEEYAHEDWGTDLKFLREKVYKWFMDSQVYYLHKKEFKQEITLEDVELYNKKGKILVNDEAYICDLDVSTGDTVYCVIKG